MASPAVTSRWPAARRPVAVARTSARRRRRRTGSLAHSALALCLGVAALVARRTAANDAADTTRTSPPTTTAAAAAAANFTAVDEWLDVHREAHVDDLKDLLRIPSISALSAHAPDVRAAAEWTAAFATARGFRHAEVVETGGHPVVYADWMDEADPSKPTVLLYGHFDVQPVDPEALWTSPPFEPTVRDGNLYARGASDDKGNMVAMLYGVASLLATNGTLPVNVKFLLEGQEEIGSPQMPAFLAAHGSRWAADYAFSADGGQVTSGAPGVCLGLRGSVALELTVTGAAAGDLHSGTYGGAIQNPLHALAELLAGMRDPATGGIAVDGFYEHVEAVSADERAVLARHPVSEAAWLAAIGVTAAVGEAGYTSHERTMVRPSLEVVGMVGGFTGEGLKTVLPAAASAKISCRLVPAQVPEDIADKITSHVRAHTPPGVSVAVTRLPFTAVPYAMARESTANAAAAAVLADLYGVPLDEVFYYRMGGSIPVVALLKRHLGLDMALFAFGAADEAVHAPNEFFRLGSFARATRAYPRLLVRLAAEHRRDLGGGRPWGRRPRRRRRGGGAPWAPPTRWPPVPRRPRRRPGAVRSCRGGCPLVFCVCFVFFVRGVRLNFGAARQLDEHRWSSAACCRACSTAGSTGGVAASPPRRQRPIRQTAGGGDRPGGGGRRSGGGTAVGQ